MFAASRQLSSLIAAAVSLVVFSGCVVSVHPLSNAKTSKVDKSLLGSWESTNPKGGTLKIEPHEKVKNAYRWTQTNRQQKPQKFLAFATEIKGRKYVSIQIRNPNKPNLRGFIFQSYEVKDKELVLRQTEQDAWVAAVKEGDLPGLVGTGKEVSDALEKRVAELAKKRKSGDRKPGDKGKGDKKEPEKPQASSDPDAKNVLVTAGSKKLRAFIGKHADKLFTSESKNRFKRVQP